MDVCRLLVLGVLLVGLCGCVRTYRSEFHQMTTTTVGMDGSTTLESSGHESGQQYHGPGLSQPLPK